MRVLIFDNDCRYQEIISYFKEKNYDIDLVSELDNIQSNLYDIIILPFTGITAKDINNQFWNNLKTTVSLFSGVQNEYLKENIAKKKLKCYYFMNDDTFISDNSYITCEGIIADIINNTDISIRNSNILVIGYGNIGKKLVNILNYLGAKTSVGIIEKKDLDKLSQLHINGYYTNEMTFLKETQKADIIINTVPKHIINETNLNKLKDDIYILDIASSPYGFNKDDINKYNINYKIYPKIPSKVAPKTSGKLLVKKINKTLGR